VDTCLWLRSYPLPGLERKLSGLSLYVPKFSVASPKSFGPLSRVTLGPKIEVATAAQALRAQRIIEGELFKYEQKVLRSNLTEVCFFRNLEFRRSGPYGGYALGRRIFLCADSVVCTEHWIRESFHHEMCHILMKRRGGFPEVRWRMISGLRAYRKSSTWPPAEYEVDSQEAQDLLERGFVSNYASTNWEEDACELFAAMMMQSPRLKACKAESKIGQKVILMRRWQRMDRWGRLGD